MILKTMDGVSFPIGDAEAKQIAEAIQKKNSHVIVRGAMIPASSIALYPDELWGEQAKMGRLHDGTRVRREFGRWVDCNNPEVRFDTEVYPEIARDEVLTEAEWNKNNLDVAREQSASALSERYFKLIGERSRKPEATKLIAE